MRAGRNTVHESITGISLSALGPSTCLFFSALSSLQPVIPKLKHRPLLLSGNCMTKDSSESSHWNSLSTELLARGAGGQHLTSEVYINAIYCLTVTMIGDFPPHLSAYAFSPQFPLLQQCIS